MADIKLSERELGMVILAIGEYKDSTIRGMDGYDMDEAYDLSRKLKIEYNNQFGEHWYVEEKE